jgi:hypothetical protein
MPGQYAHIAVVHQLTGSRLDKLQGFPAQAIPPVLKYINFVELGSISPDLPFYYPAQSEWADKMHTESTGKMIREGTALVAAMTDTGRQQKCFAWLCGYASHVAADVTVHPVVNLKSGGSSVVHRLIEMHQDSFIWDRLNVGAIGEANPFIGLNSCFPGSHLDHDVAWLWAEMLKRTYPEEWAQSAPQIDMWQAGFKLLLQKFASAGHAFPFGRHLGNISGAVYPSHHQINLDYINNLDVPGGGTEDYGAIFERAVRATETVWLEVAKGVYQGDSSYQTSIGDWSLDKGTDPTGRMVFWS